MVEVPSNAGPPEGGGPWVSTWHGGCTLLLRCWTSLAAFPQEQVFSLAEVSRIVDFASALGLQRFSAESPMEVYREWCRRADGQVFLHLAPL